MATTPDFALSLPARSASVGVVRHVLGGVREAWPVDPELLDDMLIAVGEACANVVIHAYSGTAPGVLDVSGSTEDGHVVIVVRDTGPGIVPRPQSTGLGMGLPLMAALTERMETGLADDGSHEVRLTFPKVSA